MLILLLCLTCSLLSRLLSPGIPVVSLVLLFWTGIFFRLILVIAYADPTTFTGWSQSHAHTGHTGRVGPNSNSNSNRWLNKPLNKHSNDIYSGNEWGQDSTGQLPQLRGDAGQRIKIACQMQQVIRVHHSNPAVFPVSAGNQLRKCNHSYGSVTIAMEV